MARPWLSIRVDLVEGGGHASIWPRPGRIFAAARRHTFAALATAIDDAFARWDRAHLHRFTPRRRHPDRPTRLEGDDDWGHAPPLTDGRRLTLGRPSGDEQFLYTFDLGDDWTHLCTVAPARIDPLQTVGNAPDTPLPYWGWARSPISTAASSTATTATPTSRPPPNSPTSRHCDRTGDPADRDAGSAPRRATDGSRTAVPGPAPEPLPRRGFVCVSTHHRWSAISARFSASTTATPDRVGVVVLATVSGGEHPHAGGELLARSARSARLAGEVHSGPRPLSPSIGDAVGRPGCRRRRRVGPASELRARGCRGCRGGTPGPRSAAFRRTRGA